MNLYEFLKENSENVIFCDRTGNLISVYCRNDIKVIFKFNTVHLAQTKYRQFRKELEGIKV